MDWLNWQSYLTAVDVFMETGGPVLWLIFAVAAMLWLLITERLLYLQFWHARLESNAVNAWKAREDQHSWTALKIREAKVSELLMGLRQSLGMIKTLVSLCPLLGLLGTVVGMIQVFDVMAITGTGNPRAMASGVAAATIPTMAGMVIALSGLFFAAVIQKSAKHKALLTIERFQAL